MVQYKEYGFEGKVAIITGAGSGIGEATAIELAKGGAKVVLFGRTVGKLEKVKAECLKYSNDVLALACDVSDITSVETSVAEVIKAYGRIDILVNNAGIESRLEPGETFFGTLFDKLDEETYMKFFKVHDYGHYIMNLAVIPHMQKNHFGRIVNTTSVTGIHGNYSTPAYTASKAGAICQTKAFAMKYGRDNITVNAIAPGMVDTPMKIDATPREFEIVANKTPLGRVAESIDMARVILFFAQENLFVTGQCLTCDGGSDLA
ncbi:MAG: SDR family oxidoreductase [Oscillospiraceae bacterium]|nr:SDR family oxidoreductase [Oscillospiraceae bacterium]